MPDRVDRTAADSADGADGARGTDRLTAGRRLRTPPEPVQVDARRIVAIGTVLWFVAFLVLLPFWSRLADSDNLVWIWTCLCGAGLGVIGLMIIRKHRSEGRVD